MTIHPDIKLLPGQIIIVPDKMYTKRGNLLLPSYSKSDKFRKVRVWKTSNRIRVYKKGEQVGFAQNPLNAGDIILIDWNEEIQKHVHKFQVNYYGAKFPIYIIPIGIVLAVIEL